MQQINQEANLQTQQLTQRKTAMSEQVYTYTLLTSNTPVGKIFDENLDNINAQNTITQGRVDVFEGPLDDIAEHLGELTGNNCLLTGVPRGDLDQVQLCTKADEQPGTTTREGVPVMARSAENFTFPDEPGLLMFDHDPAHWTREPLDTVDKVVDMIGRSLGIDLREFDFIAKPSSSSCVYDSDGNEVRGIQGVHVYVGVASLAVLNTKGKGNRLLDKAAELELACGVISKAGSFLKRGAFDSALHRVPNSVVYAGAAQFQGPHTSRRGVVVNNTGRSLDLGILIDGVDVAKAEGAWRALEAQYKPQQTEVRELYIKAREAQGITREQTELALHGGRLPGNWVLTRDDWTTVRIWELLNDPALYGTEQVGFRDPLEPEYGPGKAKVYIGEGRCTISSWAHGHSVYSAYLDASVFREALEASPKRSASWRGLVRLLHGVKHTEVHNTIRDLVEDEERTVGAIGAEVQGLMRDAQVLLRSEATSTWADKYAYLSQGKGEFLEVDNLDDTGRAITIMPPSFNILHGGVRGPEGESPAAFAVGSGLIPNFLGMCARPPETIGGAPPVESGFLNIWRPGPAFSKGHKEPGPWLELVHHLFPDEAEREALLDWLAWTLQKPGVKCNWQVLIKSVEGAGKDSMLEPLRWGLGRHNYKEVETQMLLGNFNEYLMGAPSLVIIQELDAAHKENCRTRLKPMAATPPAMLQVNVKNMREVLVANTFQVMVLTNEEHPFSLDGDDRRWFMLEANSKKLPHAFFNELWAWYQSGGSRWVCAWLAGRDLSGFDPNHLPMSTAYKQEVIEYSKTNYFMQVEDYLAANPTLTAVELKRLLMLLDATYGKGAVTQKQVISVLHKLGWRRLTCVGRVGEEHKLVKTYAWCSPEMVLDVEVGNVTKTQIAQKLSNLV